MGKVKRKPDLPETSPMPVLKDYDRFNVVVHVSHEHRGDQPFGLQNIYSQLLKGKEQSFSRRYNAVNEWRPPELGTWFATDQVSHVIIQNLEGQGLLVHPTETERQKIAGRILLVGFNEDPESCDELHPGEMCIRRPVNVGKLRIKALSELVSIRVTVVPK